MTQQHSTTGKLDNGGRAISFPTSQLPTNRPPTQRGRFAIKTGRIAIRQWLGLWPSSFKETSTRKQDFGGHAHANEANGKWVM